MQGKFIGIINFNKSSPKKLIKTLVDLHYRIVLINYDQLYYKLVEQFEHVEHWILICDDYRLNNKNMDKLNMDLFTLDKHFLLISHSMHKFLENKGITVHNDSKLTSSETRLATSNSHLFDTLPKKMNVFLKYKHYIEPGNRHLEILNSKDNRIMTAIYNDSSVKHPVMLLQWHPERTLDGAVFLFNWIL